MPGPKAQRLGKLNGKFNPSRIHNLLTHQIMKRKASANWKGTGLEGSGSLTTKSGVFQQQPFSFKTRFKNDDGTLGTNPEELIAAAHAGCFTMALSFQLKSEIVNSLLSTVQLSTMYDMLRRRGRSSTPTPSYRAFQKHVEHCLFCCPHYSFSQSSSMRGAFKMSSISAWLGKMRLLSSSRLELRP